MSSPAPRIDNQSQSSAIGETPLRHLPIDKIEVAYPPHDHLPPLNRDPSFWGMAATQFLGAFNDNLFKQLILLLATPTAAQLAADAAADRQAEAQIVFAASFLIFSGFAGFLSDRFSKRPVIILSKVAEIVVMLLGLFGFLF